jgi:hypothetical protein
MSLVIETVNFIKSSALSSRIVRGLFLNELQISTSVTSDRGQMVVQKQSLEMHV